MGKNRRLLFYSENVKPILKNAKTEADKFFVTHLRALRGDIKLAQYTINYNKFDNDGKKT